jgi:hypothetical protein
MPRQRSTDVAGSDDCRCHGDSSSLLDTASNEKRAVPTHQTQLSNFPTADIFSDVEVEDGRIWMSTPSGNICTAFSRSSCFSKVIGELQAEGYEAISSQYGLESLESDPLRTCSTQT